MSSESQKKSVMHEKYMGEKMLAENFLYLARDLNWQF